jgi:hypothetical protein
MIKTYTLTVSYQDYIGNEEGYQVHKGISRVAANKLIAYYREHYSNVKVTLTND